MVRTIFSVVLLLSTARVIPASDESTLRVTMTDEAGTTRDIDGRVLVRAADGGLLIEDRAGELFNVTPDRLQESVATDEPFEYLDADGLAAHLQGELGGNLQVVTTPHYVIATTGGEEYADWVGKLFERLMRGFLGYWRRAGLELEDPTGPLPAIVFGNREQFAEFATRDAGPALAEKAGYYSIRTNRIVMFDFAGGDATTGEINRRAAAAPANVATIVHEATHQIAYACGLHVRYADTPMWLAEGLAMFFETPDLRTGSGWGTIGRVNSTRLRRFREFASSSRGDESLATLVASEDRFRDPERVSPAYDESWALTYFLIRDRRDAYVEYLKAISAKPRLIWDSPAERLDEFESAFGDLRELEEQFAEYVARRLR